MIGPDGFENKQDQQQEKHEASEQDLDTLGRSQELSEHFAEMAEEESEAELANFDLDQQLESAEEDHQEVDHIELPYFEHPERIDGLDARLLHTALESNDPQIVQQGIDHITMLEGQTLGQLLPEMHSGIPGNEMIGSLYIPTSANRERVAAADSLRDIKESLVAKIK